MEPAVHAVRFARSKKLLISVLGGKQEWALWSVATAAIQSTVGELRPERC
jgi:hypothetical protein